MNDVRRKNGAQPGFVLASTLVVLAIVLSVSLAFAFVARLELKTARNAVSSSQSRFLAEAGVNYALAGLSLAAARAPYTDEAALAAGSADEVDLDNGGAFSVRVTDEAAKININSAGAELLSRLPGADATVVDSILDWRDEDENPRANGAETEFYAGLEPPYRSKNGPFDNPGEVGLVRGVTAEFLDGVTRLATVYSTDPDVAPDGRPKLDLNQADAAVLVRRLEGRWSAAEAAAVISYRSGHGAFRDLGQLVDVPGLSLEAVGRAVDDLTVDDGRPGGATAEHPAPGRVNLNTATEEVLGLLPGMSAALAAEIVDKRRQAPFAKLADLFALPSFDNEAARALLGLVTVQSRTFLVRARGWQAGAQNAQEVVAVVQFEESGPRVLSWQDGWPEFTTSGERE